MNEFTLALVRRMPWVCAKHGRRFPTKPHKGICPDCGPQSDPKKKVWNQGAPT